ncbi:MAG: hypothetical protein IKU97_04205 [Tidjanibacter sp.]|nr:hypothetical protein [Tidjanibacter sp.]
MVTYDTFRAFLRSEGCEEAFDRAFYAHNHATAFDDRMWEAVGDKGSLFGRVFRWDSTPEGRPFWRSIDKAWHDQLAATGCFVIGLECLSAFDSSKNTK